ncbi:MAG: metal ABC transporter permease [Spirochaetia bacterium]|jgi:zinc/manganese transport system permease protein
MDFLGLLRYSFFQNALAASCAVAVCAAVVGYFLIGRGLTFAGHAFPNIGFAGAAGAVLLGISPAFGLFAFTIGAALVFAFLGKEVRERDLGIGIVMTFCLGLGLFFLALYSGYAERVYGILFGTILGISSSEVELTLASSLLILLCFAGIFRPLLFATAAAESARARGVPIRALAAVFLVLTALTVSLAVQVTGSLLVFTLLVGPAATARTFFRRPRAVIGFAILLGEVYVVAGILLAALTKTLPVSFFVASLSFGGYVLARILESGKTWKR